MMMSEMSLLLVDDDEIVNFINERTLAQAGVAKQIHKARNGREALDLLNGYFQRQMSIPDVILLDIDMPIMDGFEFISAFRKLTIPGIESVKIIILTSSNSPNDIQQARALGVTNYLIKPLTDHELKEILN